MNLSLQDPFAVAQEYPETLTSTLQWGHSVVIQFNQRGDYVASGLSDGSIVIYDLACNGSVVARLESGCHTRPVTSITWSECGRYILTSSQDWCVKLWDLSLVHTKCAVIREVRFDGPIWSASMHPRDVMKFTASLVDDDPVFVEFARDPINNSETDSDQATPSGPSSNGSKVPSEDIRETPISYPVISTIPTPPSQLTLVTTFTPNGSYIFAGTNQGFINIIKTSNLKQVHSVKICNANIKNLSISSDGRKLAINSSDRIIRQVSLPDLINTSVPVWDLEVEHKYQDVVNRLQWNAVAFNYNAEFLVASTFGQSSHDLYVWETSMGSLVKILEGSNEELIDVKWNHARCTIGSTGLDTGAVYLWSVTFPQKWSALAPDFVEIEENIDYEEKEDEFDIVDEDALQKRRLEEEDTIVDVITKEQVDARGWRIKGGFVIPVNYEETRRN